MEIVAGKFEEVITGERQKNYGEPILIIRLGVSEQYH